MAPELGYSHSRRDECATPLCGAHRPTKSNPLLIKPQLGAVQGTTYDLPSNFDHEYGLRQVRDGLTSEMVVNSWSQHDGTKGVQPARDFKGLNKAAVMSACISTKQFNDFRCVAGWRRRRRGRAGLCGRSCLRSRLGAWWSRARHRRGGVGALLGLCAGLLLPGRRLGMRTPPVRKLWALLLTGVRARRGSQEDT